MNQLHPRRSREKDAKEHVGNAPEVIVRPTLNLQHPPQQLKHRFRDLDSRLRRSEREAAVDEKLDAEDSSAGEGVQLGVVQPGDVFVVGGLRDRAVSTRRRRAAREEEKGGKEVRAHLRSLRPIKHLQSRRRNRLARRLERFVVVPCDPTERGEVRDEFVVGCGGEGRGEMLRAMERRETGEEGGDQRRRGSGRRRGGMKRRKWWGGGERRKERRKGRVGGRTSTRSSTVPARPLSSATIVAAYLACFSIPSFAKWSARFESLLRVQKSLEKNQSPLP